MIFLILNSISFLYPVPYFSFSLFSKFVLPRGGITALNLPYNKERVVFFIFSNLFSDNIQRFLPFCHEKICQGCSYLRAKGQK